MIDPTAIVEDGAMVAPDARVWAYTQVRSGASIGEQTSIGSHSYIDTAVTIGQRCKIQTGVRIFQGTTIGDGVFVGPGAIVTNDVHPRAIDAEGVLKGPEQWSITETMIADGAAIGAGSVVVAGADVGRFALIGAGATVTKTVPDHAIVVGSPARQIGWACYCGRRLEPTDGEWRCPECHSTVPIPSP